eukprot:COSAG02_NODE_10145_length_2010_cov_83.400837_1_plen_56_part_10
MPSSPARSESEGSGVGTRAAAAAAGEWDGRMDDMTVAQDQGEEVEPAVGTAREKRA